MILVVMGVCGVGKTTIAQQVAEQLGWPFYEGDEFHPKANVDKMSQGIPLTDEDRVGWLDALAKVISELEAAGRSGIITCSALKQAYRDRLVGKTTSVRFVYLKGDVTLIRERLDARKGHYMPPSLLTSQFETLEEPKDALMVSIQQSPEDIVRQIRQVLGA
jgi:gluconokinase